MKKERLTTLIKKMLLVLCIGVASYFFVTLTGWKIPCVFYELTGMYCPGCGITRMFIALIQLNFKAAAGYNLLVFLLLPFGCVLGLCKMIEYIKTGKTKRRLVETIFYIVAFVCCVVFFILRNTERFSYLAP